MMTLFEDFFPSEIKAFFTDRSIDFRLKNRSGAFSKEQGAFLSSSLNIPLKIIVNIDQQHGDQVRIIDQENISLASKLEKADSVITNQPGIALTVRTADCLPIFLCDPHMGCLGLIHGGWRSTQKNIVEKTVLAMQKSFGCHPSGLLVGFGPAIRTGCYQVTEEIQEVFPDEVEETENGIALDLALVNRRQLIDLGVLGQNIYDTEICTCCDEQFFSYRREGKETGRHLSVLLMQVK